MANIDDVRAKNARSSKTSRSRKSSSGEASKRASNRSPGIAKAAQSGTKDSQQQGVGQNLVQSAQLLQGEHSKPPFQDLEDLSTLAPTSYTEVSGSALELSDSDAEERIQAILQKINAVKVMRTNMTLGTEVEGLRLDLAKMLATRVKAATGFEAVSGEVANHEAQVEATRLEREKALQKALQAEGLEGVRELITQKNQQEFALQAATIARLERRTASILGEAGQTGEEDEALPMGVDY